ncbi:hypothetical protein HYV74_01430 [Candidatus Uhrbacteria bacterium]|nr:hypothetical protein [Candidatus Uhrbacteria bacterium]
MRIYAILLTPDAMTGFRQFAETDGHELVPLDDCTALPSELATTDCIAIPISLFVPLTRALRSRQVPTELNVMAVLPMGTVASNRTTAADGLSVVYISEDDLIRLPSP